ncbi:MAG: DUF424 domain-containing protein [Methanosarcina sp.]|jgi:hypothetical protein|nr:DUF424 domain-containing protein [Methanosarcina sp.]MDD3316047.1 DUF424 domain-containing protein [Methanosarcina sp.]MDD3899539.1 DUF424 domain-containing protein [Syntrophomonadaceae bacterium]MDD4524212.1 DUF424 domain-containing protein [Methanosarcina sp.]NLN43568.1 DUF424 domain-containing protein [Methanosarcina sp.]
MYLKTYKNGDQVLVAACDEEVLGKSLKHGKAVVEISRAFYEGECVSEEKFQKALEEATTANLFGGKTISCAIKYGLIDPDSVIIIDGVPHAQFFRV